MNIFEKESVKLVDQQLNKITDGHLKILLPTSAEKVYGEASEDAKIIQVRNYNFFTRLVLNGDIGLGESWLDNEWSAEDLTGVFKIFLQNQSLSTKGGFPFGFASKLQYELQHSFGRSEPSANPNKQMSYNLNNEFFQLFLDDKTMMSSSAIFEGKTDTLSEAQIRKIRKVIELVDTTSDHHVLELGCGRAAFAIELARTCGCRVIGVTTSEEEYRFARSRVEAENMTALVNIQLCEIGEIQGSFDRIISIESIDTIGRINYNTFYSECSKLLKPGGRLIQQVTTVPEHSFEKHSRFPTWLHKNVFPGGMIPSLGELSKSISRSPNLTIETLNNVGNHYGETLRRWKEGFLSNRKELVRLGYDGIFQRKWTYFISYCEAAFDTGHMNNHHLILSRPTERSD